MRCLLALRLETRANNYSNSLRRYSTRFSRIAAHLKSATAFVWRSFARVNVSFTSELRNSVNFRHALKCGTLKSCNFARVICSKVIKMNFETSLYYSSCLFFFLWQKTWIISIIINSLFFSSGVENNLNEPNIIKEKTFIRKNITLIFLIQFQ